MMSASPSEKDLLIADLRHKLAEAEETLRAIRENEVDALVMRGPMAEEVFTIGGDSDSYRTFMEVMEPGAAALDGAGRVLYANSTLTRLLGMSLAELQGKVLADVLAADTGADIKRLLDKLDEGYDVVSGWRKNRQDKMVSRKIPSMIANKVISWIGDVPLHDYGCSLKAYRREVLKDVKLYGEMHRFIPIYASWAGARVTEIPVDHHARTAGKSKYGISRTVKVIFDLMTIKFMAEYHTKPIYVFGSFGLLAFGASVLAGLYAIFLKFANFLGLPQYHADFVETPLPVLCIVMFAISIQFFLMGLLAELLVRTYHESQDKAIYAVREKIGFNSKSE